MSSLFSSPQQVSVPVWHTGPAGFTLISRVSLSQSSFIETTFRKFPLSSPFVHRRFLVRLKKVTLPVYTVFRYASSFINPNISTLLVLLSCMMAGINPFIFSKFKSIFLYFIVILSVLYRTCLKFHQHRHSEWNEDLKVVCQSFILFGMVVETDLDAIKNRVITSH